MLRGQRYLGNLRCMTNISCQPPQWLDVIGEVGQERAFERAALSIFGPIAFTPCLSLKVAAICNATNDLAPRKLSMRAFIKQ